MLLFATFARIVYCTSKIRTTYSILPSSRLFSLPLRTCSGVNAFELVKHTKKLFYIDRIIKLLHLE